MKIGTRVQLHPATDAWMRGDRYAEIVAIGHTYLRVKTDSGRTIRVHADNILEQIIAPCGHEDCAWSACGQTPEFRAWLRQMAYEQS